MKKKRRFSNKIKEGVSNFFEDDKTDSKEENEVNLKTLIIVFVIGLVIIGVLYFFSGINQEKIIEEKIIASEKQNQSVFFDKLSDKLYINGKAYFRAELINGYKLEYFDQYSVEDLDKYYHIDNMPNKVYFNFSLEKNICDSKQAILLNYTPLVGDKSAWVSFVKELVPSKWSQFKGLNIIFKTENSFKISFRESDGDWWGYLVENVSNNDCQELFIPFEDFFLTEPFEEGSNGELDLNEIVAYQLFFENSISNFRLKNSLLTYISSIELVE